MTGRRQAIVLGICAVLAPCISHGQQVATRHRVGILWGSGHTEMLRPFKEAMSLYGWTEGRNLEYVERITDTSAPNLDRLVADLVGARVEVLLVDEFAVARSIEVARSVPIVCPNVSDPIVQGFTHSLARPDRNVTGVSWGMTEGKRLQFARELVPGLSRIAVLFDASDATARHGSSLVVSSAQRQSIAATMVGLRDASSLPAAFEELKKTHPQVLMVYVDALTASLRREIIHAAAAARLPVVSEIRSFAQEGAVLSYGPNNIEGYRRGAYFVNRILNGGKVTDLPFEQLMTFDLVVNMKAARALGISIPEDILQAATEVIR